MKLTIMLIFVSAAFVAFGQDISDPKDFNGVTIGGTVDQPTIINHSGKGVIGYTISQNTGNGARVNVDLDMRQLANNNPILPGDERSGVVPHGFGGRGLNQQAEEKVTSVTLLAVLFADGSFIGPDQWREVFSERMSQWRSAARDTQYLAEKYHLLEEERRRLFRTGRRSPISAMAVVLLAIRDTKGETESEAALARLASLPEVKGENQ